MSARGKSEMGRLKLRQLISYCIYALICLLAILFQSAGFIDLRFETATAFLTLPIVLYGGFYFGEYGGAAMGFVVGAATDTYASTTYYNTIMLTALGFAAGLFVSYFFNRNLAAASVINTVAAIFYFFVKWINVYAFCDPEPLYILTRYSLPSMVLTVALGVLLFFPINFFLKKLPLRTTKK